MTTYRDMTKPNQSEVVNIDFEMHINKAHNYYSLFPIVFTKPELLISLELIVQ